MKREIGLFFFLLVSATDSHDINCPSEPVKAEVGDNVTLGCHLESKRNVTGELVEWKFNGSHNVVVYKSRDIYPPDQAEQFKDRATLDKKELEKGNLTVKISSVNTADGGNYTCSCSVGDGISCDVRLTVEKSSNKSKAKSSEGTDTTPSLENGNKDWIIGLSVVGSVVIAVLAVVLGFLIWRKCQHQNPAEQGDGTEMTTLQQPQNQQRDDNTAGENVPMMTPDGGPNPQKPQEDDKKTENLEQQLRPPMQMRGTTSPRHKKSSERLHSDDHTPRPSEDVPLMTPGGEPNLRNQQSGKTARRRLKVSCKTKRQQAPDTRSLVSI